MIVVFSFTRHPLPYEEPNQNIQNETMFQLFIVSQENYLILKGLLFSDGRLKKLGMIFESLKII